MEDLVTFEVCGFSVIDVFPIPTCVSGQFFRKVTVRDLPVARRRWWLFER